MLCVRRDKYCFHLCGSRWLVDTVPIKKYSPHTEVFMFSETKTKFSTDLNKASCKVCFFKTSSSDIGTSISKACSLEIFGRTSILKKLILSYFCPVFCLIQLFIEIKKETWLSSLFLITNCFSSFPVEGIYLDSFCFLNCFTSNFLIVFFLLIKCASHFE